MAPEPVPPSAPFLVALEGGGTRCQAALFDGAGHLWHTCDAGPVNTNFVPLAEAQAAARQAVLGVLAAASLPAEGVSHLVTALVAAAAVAEAARALCPTAAYRAYAELAIVFARAGLYRPHGVAVVAATGCTVGAVRADDGRALVLGGWGALLGDEGSAYALGLAGLRAAARAFEQRAAAPTALVEAVAAHFNLGGVDFRAALIERVYQPPLSRTAIAHVAPVVTALAAQGDPLALRLTAKVAGDLADLTLHAARRVFQPDEAFAVAVAGGLTNAGDLLLAPLTERLAVEFPLAAVHVGRAAPAVALGRLALHDLKETPC